MVVQHVVVVSVPVRDAERAKEFYTDVVIRDPDGNRLVLQQA